MEFFIAILLDILEQGLIYGIMALGVYLSFKILNFPDISVDGTFPLGAAVSVSLILHGVNPWLSLLVAFAAGLVAGSLTGFFHVTCKINKLFSGIIVMTILYSINIVVAGAPNQHLFMNDTLFDTAFIKAIPSFGPMIQIGVGLTALVLVLMVKFALDYFLKTQKGLLLRATGDNEKIVTAMSVNPGRLKILGLALANGLVALSGAILAQQSGVFNVSMGTGTMTMGLASVIMGLILFGKILKVPETSAVILGSILYKALVSIAINLGAPSQLLNLVRGLLFFLILLGDRLYDKGGRFGKHKARSKVKEAM